VKVYVVYCHPLEGSFVSCIRDAALAGFAAAGHEVRLTDLYAEGFDPVLSAYEKVNHLAPPETKDAILPYADHLRWCDALVLIYPTWWSAQPAMLKGWIDRVWVRGVAYDIPPDSNIIAPRLQNIRRVVAITTHGSSKFVNAVQGECGKRVVTRSLRVLCHRWARARWVAMYGLDHAGQRRRERFLERVERTMRRL
jgi:putative NADPH-quinone reductase